jgi:hypothetical protein
VPVVCSLTRKGCAYAGGRIGHDEFPKWLNGPISVRFEPQWQPNGACVEMGGHRHD